MGALVASAKPFHKNDPTWSGWGSAETKREYMCGWSPQSNAPLDRLRGIHYKLRLSCAWNVHYSLSSLRRRYRHPSPYITTKYMCCPGTCPCVIHTHTRVSGQTTNIGHASGIGAQNSKPNALLREVPDHVLKKARPLGRRARFDWEKVRVFGSYRQFR